MWLLSLRGAPEFKSFEACWTVMAALVYLGERSQMYGRDSNFTEVINQRMRVPERLRVGHGILPDELNQTSEDPPTVYSMHVPDRLALTDAPDLSPQPLFSKQSITGHDLSSWDLQIVQHGAWHREVQSPLRRSYSDQAFGKTPPRTPTQPRQAVHSSSLFSSPDSPPCQPAEVHSDRAQKSAMQESCLGPEGEAGTAVEFIVLRRQVVKMSRRIVALERHNAERRQTELVLFSLLVSACLFNGWLWIRR
ncbi:hypothetical protein P4O66_016552 [Electrophorus voltai]|uniref:Mitochondrial fission factor n=1 Tax=Electrophorus voltai TaxID=2609070 RepID=A0AAD8YY19_9TELE|nr:hypothetical protein P4O66_016552 [Electrophorus voltai]